MSFVLPDLVIESILREGFTSIRRNPKPVERIFDQLDQLGPVMNKKYGDAELNRIKKYFQENEIKIVQSFSQVAANLPCISIQLAENAENEGRAHLEDFEGMVDEKIMDPDELKDLIIVDQVPVDSYDPFSGQIEVPDSVDLTNVKVNNLFIDASDNQFSIVGGIDNTSGQKKFFVEPGSEVDDTGKGQIKSSIDFKRFEQRGNVEDEKLLLGIHSEERPLTIYLYILVKFFLNSRKEDLIKRGFQLSTYTATDFTRTEDYNEPVFSRFLTVSGMLQNQWSDRDEVEIIENIEPQVEVPKDEVDYDPKDATVQTGPHDQE